MFINYRTSNVEVKDLNPVFTDPQMLRQSLAGRFAADGKGENGSSARSRRVTCTTRLTIRSFRRRDALLAVDGLAGLGGNTRFINPRTEGIWYSSGPKPGPLWGFGCRRSTSRRMATPACCRFSRRSSWVASTASGDSTSGPSARATRCRACDRRKQECSGERRIPHQHHGARPAGAVRRCRPGPGYRREVRVEAGHYADGVSGQVGQGRGYFYQIH